MRSDHELKAEARSRESKGELAGALELYQQALRAAARDPDAMPDPTLHLKVADLEYRLGRMDAALEGYRGAAALYRDLGLMVNAVAVWKKVERVYPDEPESWLRLADLQLDMGLVAEARVSMRRYVEVSGEAPDDQVSEALRAFLDRDPDPGLGVLLARRLGAHRGRPEAMRTLRDVYERAVDEGRVTAELERELDELESKEP